MPGSPVDNFPMDILYKDICSTQSVLPGLYIYPLYLQNHPFLWALMRKIP